MSAKFSFAFYVLIDSFNCKKQSYFAWNLFYLSKKVLDQTYNIYRESS